MKSRSQRLTRTREGSQSQDQGKRRSNMFSSDAHKEPVLNRSDEDVEVCSERKQ